MNTPEEEALLIEALTSAWRPKGETVQAHPAWYDLDEAGREQAFEETARLRRMEAAMDQDGLSTTSRAVLGAILNAEKSR